MDEAYIISLVGSFSMKRVKIIPSLTIYDDLDKSTIYDSQKIFLETLTPKIFSKPKSRNAPQFGQTIAEKKLSFHVEMK